MNRALPAVLIALCVSGTVALSFQRGALNDARRIQEELSNRIERLESRQEEKAAKKAVEELQEQVARAEKKAIAASAAVEAAGRAPGSAAPAPSSLPPTLEEDIQKIVDARLEEKLQSKSTGKGGGEDRKMPLFDLAKELSLDDAMQGRVASVANTVKKEIFDILKTPRADGTNMADDLLAAFTSGETSAVQKLFGRLFTEKIPGTDTLYVTAVSRVQDQANQGLKQAMGPEAFGRYQGMNLKPENIETGFDPWMDYLHQKGK